MKKILILMVMMLFISASFSAAYAAGTCTVSEASAGSPMVRAITYSCTGDASTGSIPATSSPAIFGWVFKVVTIPGTPSPTNLYDITLTDSNGIDVLSGQLADRSSTSPEEVKIGNYVSGTLTLNINNQSVASAAIRVIVYYYIEN